MAVASARALRHSATPRTAAAKASAAATLQATKSRRRFGSEAAVVAVSVTQESSSATSCADWNRSSGSFARQVRTTRSRAAGVIGRTALIGGGSAVRMDAIRLALLFP